MGPASIVIPVHDDRASVQHVLREIAHLADIEPYIILIDDASQNDPVHPDDLRATGLTGVVLRLSNNRGHQRAILAGLHYAAGHMGAQPCVIMDGDGEDRPQAVPVLLRALAASDVDVVLATRGARSDPFWIKMAGQGVRLVFRLATGHRLRHGNFMALGTHALAALAASDMTGIHVAATVARLPLIRVEHVVDRGQRHAGKSRMTLTALMRHARAAFVVMADAIARRARRLACVLAGTSLVLACIGWITGAGLALALTSLALALAAGLVMFWAVRQKTVPDDTRDVACVVIERV